MDFGDRLRTLRENKGLNQTEFAVLMGKPNQNVSNYERGFRQPNYEALVSFADYFEVSTDYLLGRPEKSVDNKDDITTELSDTTLNKEEFAQLLKLAKGKRSINQYALHSGVSAAHISRLLRGLVDAPPQPSTIRLFAEKAYNKVTYGELMVAAGHFNESVLSDSIEHILEDCSLKSTFQETVMQWALEREHLHKEDSIERVLEMLNLFETMYDGINKLKN